MAVQSAEQSVESVGPAGLEWRDSKRYAWLLGTLIPALPFLGWGLVSWTGYDAFWFTAPVVFFVVIPLIDLAAGLDPNNPPDEVLERLENDRYYRWITYLFIPMQYLTVLWTVWMISQPQFDVVDRIGMAVSAGMVAGIAFDRDRAAGGARAREGSGRAGDRHRTALHAFAETLADIAGDADAAAAQPDNRGARRWTEIVAASDVHRASRLVSRQPLATSSFQCRTDRLSR